jgi:hypothetical protein
MCVQVAVSLKGMAKVGKVNCEKYRQLCSQAGITGYPTIRYQLTFLNSELWNIDSPL